MKWYKKIPIWENLRRTEFLLEFKNLIVEYFTKVKFSDLHPVENEEVQKIRSKINIKLSEAHSIILSSGTVPRINYSPPPAIGGGTTIIDLLNDIFMFSSFRIDSRLLIDFIERSIGIYEADKTNAFGRTINPFYWLFSILEFVVSIPFKILGYAGLDQERIESSLFGRLIKAILYLITAFAAFLTILDKLGYLE